MSDPITIDATPSELAILVFGSINALAGAAGVSRTMVQRWKRRGLVPASYQRLILDVADDRGLDVTPRDLIYGRRVLVTQRQTRAGYTMQRLAGKE